MQTEFGERLKLVRGDRPQKLFAEQLGFHTNTIGRWERGDKYPTQPDIERILDHHPHINPTWLLVGEGHMTRNGEDKTRSEFSPHREEPSRIIIDANGCPQIPRWNNPDPEMYDYIPLAKTRLSAGGGSFVLNEEIEGYYAFRNSWLNAVATSKRNLILMRVTGDSMLPTLQSGDTVMIDTGRKYIKEGDIYALRVEDTVVIKRLAYRIGGKVMIISDNRDEFETYEANPQDVHVLGQIIFFSRVLIQE